MTTDRRLAPPYLVKQGDIEREAELVLEADLVAELVTELAGRGRRVSQQRLGVAVHERDGQHQRLLVLRGLWTNTVVIRRSDV